MKTLNEFPKGKIHFVFTDIDDTLTDDGRLHPKAFDSLWQLYRANVHVIPVTGRPAGWCELIARQWPVSGVIGENGGFYFRLVDRQMKRHFLVDENTRRTNQKKLEDIQTEILTAVPGSAVASDQFSRLLDLAIDFCEDVAPLASEEVDKIVAIFHKHGAVAKVSSIHVNGWFGQYDKLSMCRIFCEREFQFSIDKNNTECLFVGDSPNDEPMFQFFQNSVGVANVADFKDRLHFPPKFVTLSRGGLGFTELADKLLT